MNNENAVRALTALAQIHRLGIFKLLIRQGPSGLTAGEISTQMNISATSASFHLKELVRAGLIFATRDGRFLRYATHVDGMRELLTFLTEDCCQGRPEICGQSFSSSDEFCKTREILKDD